MEIVVDFILGYASSPVEMAVCFLVFVMIVDAVFSVVSSLFSIGRR